MDGHVPTDIELRLVTYKVDQVQLAVAAMDLKLDEALRRLVAHEERISALQSRGTWGAGIFATAIGFLIKDKLGA